MHLVDLHCGTVVPGPPLLQFESTVDLASKRLLPNCDWAGWRQGMLSRRHKLLCQLTLTQELPDDFCWTFTYTLRKSSIHKKVGASALLALPGIICISLCTSIFTNKILVHLVSSWLLHLRQGRDQLKVFKDSNLVGGVWLGRLSWRGVCMVNTLLLFWFHGYLRRLVKLVKTMEVCSTPRLPWMFVGGESHSFWLITRMMMQFIS